MQMKFIFLFLLPFAVHCQSSDRFAFLMAAAQNSNSADLFNKIVSFRGEKNSQLFSAIGFKCQSRENGFSYEIAFDSVKLTNSTSSLAGYSCKINPLQVEVINPVAATLISDIFGKEMGNVLPIVDPAGALHTHLAGVSPRHIEVMIDRRENLRKSVFVYYDSTKVNQELTCFLSLKFVGICKEKQTHLEGSLLLLKFFNFRILFVSEPGSNRI
jgi:hypothetical protein